MPVNVFVNGNPADEVKLTVKTEGPLALGTESVQVLKLPPFSGSSDQTRDALAHFTLSTAEQTGNAKVIVRAKCGSSEISDTLSLEVKSLMPSVTRSRADCPGRNSFIFNSSRSGIRDGRGLHLPGFRRECLPPEYDEHLVRIYRADGFRRHSVDCSQAVYD